MAAARSRDLKDKLMSLDPLVSFLVPLGEVEAVAQRDYVVWAHVLVR